MYCAAYEDELKALRQEVEVCREYLRLRREWEEDPYVTILYRTFWKDGSRSGLVGWHGRISWFVEEANKKSSCGHDVITVGIELGDELYGLCNDLFDAYHHIGKYVGLKNR